MVGLLLLNCRLTLTLGLLLLKYGTTLILSVLLVNCGNDSLMLRLLLTNCEYVKARPFSVNLKSK